MKINLSNFKKPVSRSKLTTLEVELLNQLMREIAIGIYVHDAVPFFSLHFNAEQHMVPVIHPVYDNTLVGKVISLLDYFMKGYLNGGVFKEKFIYEWQQNPPRDSQEILGQIINFHKVF